MELRFHSSHSDYDYYGIEQKTADERTAECLNYMSTKPGQAQSWNWDCLVEHRLS
jgi:hypothetical protein